MVAFWGAIAITLCGAVFIVTEDWRLYTGADLFQLFVAAFFVGIAIYLVALGYATSTSRLSRHSAIFICSPPPSAVF